MTDPNWEEVDIPRGAYFSWRNEPGQEVFGKVLTYKVDGGTDFNGNVCPLLEVELREPTFTAGKNGEEPLDAGEDVVLNAGQAQLKRGLRAASPAFGDLIRILLKGSTSSGAKDFGIRIARGAAIDDESLIYDDEPLINDEPPPDPDGTPPF
jgi:hypothetical protein